MLGPSSLRRRSSVQSLGGESRTDHGYPASRCRAIFTIHNKLCLHCVSSSKLSKYFMIIFIDFENGKLRLEATKVPNSQDKPASIITQGTDAEEAMAYLLKLRCLHFNKDNMMIISFYKKRLFAAQAALATCDFWRNTCGSTAGPRPGTRVEQFLIV